MLLAVVATHVASKCGIAGCQIRWRVLGVGAVTVPGRAPTTMLRMRSMAMKLAAPPSSARPSTPDVARSCLAVSNSSRSTLTTTNSQRLLNLPVHVVQLTVAG